MLLTLNDFTGEFAIGQYQLNSPLLQDYIDNHEIDFFVQFATTDYYNDITTRITSTDPDVKAAAQAEFAKFKFALVGYVWLWYVSREQEKLTGGGITLQRDENAVPVNIDTQCRRVWNEIVFKLQKVDIQAFHKREMRYRNCLGI